jgi:integrase
VSEELVIADEDTDLRIWDEGRLLDRLPIPDPVPGPDIPVVVAAQPWGSSDASADEILGPIDGLEGSKGRRSRLRSGVRALLRWLEQNEGVTWQERWQASGIEDNERWTKDVIELWNVENHVRHQAGMAVAGAIWLMTVDAIRPSYEWLHRRHVELYNLDDVLLAYRDPAARDAVVQALITGTSNQVQAKRKRGKALPQLAKILAHTGKRVLADISIEDLAEARESARGIVKLPSGAAYDGMSLAGLLPPDAPRRFINTRRTRQLTVQELIERTGIRSPSAKHLFVDYFRARTGLTYATRTQLITKLVKNFWLEIETLVPGIDSFEIDSEVIEKWQHVIQTIRHGTHSGKARQDIGAILEAVRVFYFHLNDWAQADPIRYGHLAAPNPIAPNQTKERAKRNRLQRAASHARTRERMPFIDKLLAYVEDERRRTRAVLDLAETARVGDTFVHAGIAYERVVVGKKFAVGMRSYGGGERIGVRAIASGVEFDAGYEETIAFWRWAAIMTLRETGCRIEELEELTHASIVQYKVPATGEVLPLLQIAPSKNDKERIMLMSEELADVIVAVISRVRVAGDGGKIPLVTRWDYAEKTESDALPFLFQRFIDGENRLINRAWILRQLSDIAKELDHRNEAGDLVRFHNHDVRRIFATEAVMTGFPVHVLAKVLGHSSLETTMRYVLVYGEDVYRSQQKFFEKRRALRPSAEYREPTDEEVEEFLGHFERRQLELGTCGRAYGAACAHEHACIRCTMFRPDARAVARLVEIVENLEARIVEAEEHGWLGEVEGLKTSLAGAKDKLEKARRKSVAIGMPTLRAGI